MEKSTSSHLEIFAEQEIRKTNNSLSNKRKSNTEESWKAEDVLDSFQQAGMLPAAVTG